VKLDGLGDVKMSGNNGGNPKTAYLTLNVQPNFVYTLTAHLDPLNAGQVYLGFGTSGVWDDVLELRGNAKPQLNGVKFGSVATDSGPQDVILTLDTTGSIWTTTAEIIGGDTFSLNYVTNPTSINQVGFWGGNGNSQISNFALNIATPEPSSYALGLIMLGVLAFEIRRRRALAA
jgi:hypothetical protein